MELDEFKTAWQALDRRLARQNALQLAAFRYRRLGDARRSLRPLAWGQLATIVFGIAMLVLGLGAWTQHRDVGAVFASGLLMHAYGVLVIIAGGSTLARIRSIDYAAPVLVIQQQLAHLRRGYVRWGMIIGLPWWLLWLPALISLARVDLTGVPWMTEIALAVGFTGLLATWAFERWLRRPGRERLARALDDGAAGRSLGRATALVDDVATFERERHD